MAIKTKSNIVKPEIDLSGPQGNAFYLLGVAADLSKKMHLDFKPIEKEMTSGNYENLISVFDFYFGDIIDLVR